MMTYEEVIAFAKKHYNDGGDGIVETLDEDGYEMMINEFGIVYTEETLLQEFEDWKQHCEDMMGY